MAYKTASSDRYELLKEFARENRKNPTMAEQVLWAHLRNNILGVRFLRQHIIGDYIADFVIDNSVIIELKAVSELNPTYEAQVINYLMATGLKVGLLINFGQGELQVKRLAANIY